MRTGGSISPPSTRSARDHAGKNDVPDGIIGVSEYEYVDRLLAPG